MRYYIIAGEASGDLHASNLMKSLKEKDPLASFRYWGGDRMQAQGGELVKHYRDLAFMGFVEVLLNLRTIVRNMDFCKKDILDFKPDALILVDYPGFNLRIAEFAHAKGMKVYYYISPQVWAWKKSRVHTIRKVVDRMFVILPFEKDFYAAYGIEVDFVGHPLLDAIIPATNGQNPELREEFIQKNGLVHKPVIAVLPGSRKQEIVRVLPELMKIWKFFKLEYQWVIAGVSTVDQSIYDKIISGTGAKVVYNQTYDLLDHAYAAIVTSGTASLETALHKVPQVICYKGGAVSFAIARKIVDVKYIGLPNLILDKPVVEELIQQDLTGLKLIYALESLLFDGNRRKAILTGYHELHDMLGGPGASGRTAELIIRHLTSPKTI